MKPLPFFQTLARPDDLLYRHLERVALRSRAGRGLQPRPQRLVTSSLTNRFVDIRGLSSGGTGFATPSTTFNI